MTTKIDGIREALQQMVGVPPESVTFDAAIADLGVDSLLVLELANLLEKRFGVVIEQPTARKWITVGDIASFLETGAAA